jgi:VWFA-related protein
MIARSWIILGLLAALAAPLILQPQQTIEVRSQLVVVDVTVTDGHGRPVTDLKRSDFQVFENGKSERIVAFQPHAFKPHPPEPKAAQTAPAQLPKGVFSNIDARSHSPSVPALNIILFDELNSSVESQMFGRQELIKFLKSLPPGQPTALFELRESLRVMASFSTDSSRLVAAAEKLVPYRSGWFVSEDQAGSEVGTRSLLSRMGRGSPPPPDTGAALNSVRSRGLGERLRITLRAFRSLANAVAGYPGRKNLLWLSEGFPVRFSPEGTVSRPNVMASSTAARLASQQVAVYPIDTQGLAGMENQGSTPGSVAEGKGPAPVANLLASRRRWLWESQTAMDGIAEDTGGRAFSNSNNLQGAFNRVFEAGANYYTLAYAPTDQNWNGEFRHIKVTLHRKGLHLAYRKGYYATEWSPSPAQAEQIFLKAMYPGIPEATMLAFKTIVRPMGPNAHEVIVGYYVSGEDVAFQNSKNGRKIAQIKFAAIAYTRSGKPDSVASHLVTLRLKPREFKKILQRGILFRQPLQLRPGDDHLCVGVLDKQTGSFGTLDLPVESLDIKH